MIVANKEYKTKQYLITVETDGCKDVFHLTPEFNDDTKQGIVESHLCECGAALCFFEYGIVQKQDLRWVVMAQAATVTSPPSRFEIEIWEVKDNDDHKWQHTKSMTFDGVVWGKKYHTNPEDSMCSGVGHFTYTSRFEEDIKDGEVAEIPLKRHTYPQMQLCRVLNGTYAF